MKVKIPPKIFKYVGPERIDIIKHLTVRFTQPSCCNDPFEAQTCIEGLEDESLLREQMERIDREKYRTHVLRNGPILAGTFEEFRKLIGSDYDAAIKAVKADLSGSRQRAAAATRTFWDTLGLLSLTETENNILMWAHYTDGHKGMLLEFDPAHSFLKPPDCDHPNPDERQNDIQFGAMAPVTYSTKRPRRRLGEQFRIADFFTKSPQWGYEHEWRVIQLLERSHTQKQTPGGMVHLFTIPPECVRRVVIGCCMGAQNRAELLKAIRSNAQLKHVQIQETQLDLDVFQLNYVSVQQ
ncbi:MAG TPA: DUF2971 domain-containing protein [Verrucomicrobiae bacterium]|nr:DUF2971 domain-containing protein [Verrucomicrobiae bacterium]